MTGRVSLIGAGPGDPDLITRRGLRLLATADVVLYDRLAPRALLEDTQAEAKLIDVGKHPGRPTPSQPWINDLIVEHALRGAHVVRLKGGDGYVFGRGGEEVQAARAAGIAVEVVPGVSSGIAVPAAAGVPLTHRGVSRSVAFVTGVTDWDYPIERSPIDDVAHVETICIFMGLATIRANLDRLIELGRDPRTPVISIAEGCTPAQREVVAPLASHADAVEAAGLPSPVMTVIGNVVRLRDELTALMETVS